jgi:hypothetical protein
MADVYRLKGYDPFSSDYYDIGAEFPTLQEAEAAARKELDELEVAQPSAQSGGQDGIQDRVYIIHPNGQYVRFR